MRDCCIMSRISKTFESLKSTGCRAIIPYLTAGFPTPEHTVSLLQALEAGGADVIELGVPFSDPIADGPTIQRASAVALEHGVTVPWVLKTLQEFRATGSEVPVVLFGAYNPLFHYGLEKFATDAAQAGADGVLIADLPADEGDEVEPVLAKAGLDLIYLVAPTTPRERKKQICNRGSGFIYYISVKGVTGARAELSYQLDQPLEEIRACSELPVAVGFGISTPAQAAAVAQVADGIIVGSALIDLVQRKAEDADLLKEVAAYIRSLKDAVSINATTAKD